MSTKPAAAGLEWTDADQRAVDTARVLAMDAVEKVGDGHAGTAMSLAPAAYLLFQNLYIQLFLAGYGLELKDLKSFRRWDSRTPGHPEHGRTVGVEATTGPLGQGIANAVGMAMRAIAPRAASGEVVKALGEVPPELWGGSADLAGANRTTIDELSSFLPADTPLPGAHPYGRTCTSASASTPWARP